MTQQWAVRPVPVDSRANAGTVPLPGPLSFLSGVVAYYDALIANATSGAWSDLSGNGHNLAGAGITPNASGGPNNGPYASAAGAGHLTSAFTLVQPSEIFALVSSSWVTSGPAQCICDGSAVLGGACQFAPTGSNGMGINAGVNATWASNPLPASTWRNYNFQLNGASSQIVASGLSSGALGSIGAGNLSGITLFVAGNQSSNPLTGHIALFVACSSIQSAPNRAAMIAYMTSRGGV